MMIALSDAELSVQSHKPVKVLFREKPVGAFHGLTPTANCYRRIRGSTRTPGLTPGDFFPADSHAAAAAADCPFRCISRALSRKIAAPSPFKEEISMKDKTDQTIPLEAAKVEFLEQMVQAHGLSDIGKAVRCLIDYARENPDRQAVIFEEVRCVDC